MNFNFETQQKLLIKSGHKIVLYVTGCASKALEWFTSLPGSSSYALQSSNFYSKGSLALLLNKDIDKFVTSQIALEMAQQALIKSHEILRNQNESDPTKYMSTIGIGITGSIATISSKQGQHSAYICIHFLNARYIYQLVLAKGQRQREDEDYFISALTYHLVNNLIQSRKNQEINHIQYNNINNLLEQIQLQIFEEDLLIILEQRNTIDEYDLLTDFSASFFNLIINVDGSQHLNCVLQESVVLSGSFNPLHIGHISLAEESSQLSGFKNIYYEISLHNPDKGIISKDEMFQRLKQFQGKYPVILSMKQLFKDKNIFLRNGAFAIGIDTYKRIINTKYYNNSTTDRDISFVEFLKNNNKFIVAPRQCPQTHEVVKIKRIQLISFIFNFKKLENLKQFEIPSLLQKNVLSLDGFRNDVSSTILRDQFQSR